MHKHKVRKLARFDVEKHISAVSQYVTVCLSHVGKLEVVVEIERLGQAERVENRVQYYL